MEKELTITISEDVYQGLYKRVGPQHISQFIEDVLRSYVVDADLEAGYRQMAEDTAQEAEALDWAEALIGDVADETW